MADQNIDVLSNVLAGGDALTPSAPDASGLSGVRPVDSPLSAASPDGRGPQSANPQSNQDPSVPDVTKSPTFQADANKPKLWQTILMGALSGLAGTAGARTVADAAAGGAAGGIKYGEQQKQDDLEKQQNARANANADDIHQSHLANGLLVNMQIQHQWDLMHPNYQKQSVETMSAYNATLQASGVTPSFTGSEHDAATEAQKLITGADPSSRFSYRVLPSISKQGQFDVVQVPSGSTTKDTPVQTMGPDGKITTVTAKAGTPWATIDAANSALQKTNAEIGTKKLEAQNAADIKAKADAKTASATPGPVGSDFLKTLPPGRLTQVQAIGEGRVSLPPGRSKESMALASDVTRAYPDFDQTKATSYAATRKDFTSGNTSKNINAINTVLGHMGKMYDHTTALATIPGVSSIARMAGNTDANELQVARNAAIKELEKVYTGSGAISEGEVKQWRSMLEVASPAELKAKIAGLADLLTSKLSAYQTQWENGMPKGVVTPIQIVNPESAKAYQRITGHTTEGQAVPTQQPNQSQGHGVGDVVVQNGRNFTVTSVDENGKVTGAK